MKGPKLLGVKWLTRYPPVGRNRQGVANPLKHMKFKERTLAHRLLDGLVGIEIGPSAQNSLGRKTRNVDYTASLTAFKEQKSELGDEAQLVDLVSPGDELPLLDSSVDYVLSSHVIQQFPDPIKALREWHRVVKPGGYLYIVAPHMKRTFDKERPRTTLAELISRHENGKRPVSHLDHYSVWITEDFVEIIRWLGWTIVEVQDTDDKAGNCFTVVVQVKTEVVATLSRPTLLHVVNAKVPTIPTLTPLLASPGREQRTAPRSIRNAEAPTPQSQDGLEFEQESKDAPPELQLKVIKCDALVARPAPRFIAIAVDLSIVLLALGLFIAVFFLSGGEMVLNRQTAPFLVGAAASIALFYRLLWCLANCDTPGMHFAGLRLVDFDGRVPKRAQRGLRQVASVLSFIPAGLGFAWALVDQKNLTWHDHFSKTFPTSRS